jgi:outer membrane autotransporter protein
MQVAVVSGSKAFNLGDILSEVVKSTNKLIVTELNLNQTKLPDNSALLDFELKYDEVKKQIDLVVAKINTLKEIEQISGKKYSYNATQVDIAARKSQNDNLLAKLQTVDSAHYENALESLVPTTQLSAINASNQITSNISNIVSSRLSDIKSGLNSGSDMQIDNDRVWIKASGGLAKQKDKDFILGFDLKAYGLGIGYDKEYKDNQFIGFATFYTNANIETNQLNHVNDIDAYSIVGYGSNLLKNDKTTIYYQVAHSWQKNNTKREVFTGETASSEFTSKNLSADLNVGHKINLNEKVSIEPKIGLEYKYYNSPVVIEKGTVDSNVRTDKFNSSELIGNLGAEIEYKINKNSRFITSLKGGYDLKNSKDKILTSSFVNSQDVLFNSKTINNGRLKYEAGIGYDINLDEQNNFNIFYKHLEEGNKYNYDVVTLNYNYKF